MVSSFRRWRHRLARSSGRQVIPWTTRSASEYADDCRFLRELIEAGKIRSAIDRCYPLDHIAAAHRYVDTGRKQGHVVITVAQDSSP
jgi:NADPH:quinone reductase-like Zn-dependent oxidoreductase